MGDSHDFDDAIAEQAAASESYTPIRARTGRVVHAITMHDTQRTACGRKLIGGVIVARALSCKKCRLLAGV